VKALAPPVVVALAVLFQVSPFGFLLEGLHVWIHELGHSSVAWLCGDYAVPLPFGWSNIGADRSLVVYFAVLGALGALAYAGWRERRAWPVFLGLVLVGVQASMTWRLPAYQGRLWMIFAGVGGEFYLSAAMVGLFYFEFPEKFRWGACRYLVLFIGAASFFESYAFWRKVASGAEGIPYGSLISGEDDGGGDMNILHFEYHWTQHRIIATYSHLSEACLVILGVVYLFFNLRLDRWINPLLGRILSAGLSSPPNP
jgi:hypothetical protein